jgi:D-glycero-alpha-D-manno-heptose-7-phosphate kinase
LSQKISNSAIDDMYSAAKAAGAVGGKLLGAGAGGFLLLLVEPERQINVREALAHLTHVPFKFENQGSAVVLYQPEGL